MRKMRKPGNEGRSPRTLGELVTLAFDVCPSRAAAVKLVGHLLRGRFVHVGGGANPAS